jgi:hypothetical protein
MYLENNVGGCIVDVSGSGQRSLTLSNFYLLKRELVIN